MPVFLSTFVNKVDRKGRVSVPAQFRAALADDDFPGIVAFQSLRDGHDAIEAFGMERMKQLVASVEQQAVFASEREDLAATLFGDCYQLPFDGEGRVLLPEPLRAYAGIDGQAAFLGLGATFQIWEPERLAAYKRAARQRAHAGAAQLRLASPALSPGGAA